MRLTPKQEQTLQADRRGPGAFLGNEIRFFSMTCRCRLNNKHVIAEGVRKLCFDCDTALYGREITSEKYLAFQALLAFAKSLTLYAPDLTVRT